MTIRVLAVHPIFPQQSGQDSFAPGCFVSLTSSLPVRGFSWLDILIRICWYCQAGTHGLQLAETLSAAER